MDLPGALESRCAPRAMSGGRLLQQDTAGERGVAYLAVAVCSVGGQRQSLLGLAQIFAQDGQQRIAQRWAVRHIRRGAGIAGGRRQLTHGGQQRDVVAFQSRQGHRDEGAGYIIRMSWPTRAEPGCIHWSARRALRCPVERWRHLAPRLTTRTSIGHVLAPPCGAAAHRGRWCGARLAHARGSPLPGVAKRRAVGPSHGRICPFAYDMPESRIARRESAIREESVKNPWGSSPGKFDNRALKVL